MISQWNLECEVESPLHIVNLFRRVIMHEVGCYKLDIHDKLFVCDDPFIIAEYIVQRLHQIPVNQQMHSLQFSIDVKNGLDQEMCITTDHIRVGGKSAVKAGLCGKYLICKLGIGKQLKIQMIMRFDRPKTSDQYRCCMFFATEVKQAPGHQSDALKLSHTRERSICKMQTFGTLPLVRFVNDKVVTTELKRVVRENIQEILVEFKDQFITVRFERVPGYLLDPVVCVCISELRKICNQIQINTLQNCLILGTDRHVQAEDLESIKGIISNGLEALIGEVQRLEDLLIQAAVAK